MTKYGKANPRPKLVKIKKDWAADWVKAYPRAVPIKGAVQGVATRVINIPLKDVGMVPWPETKFCKRPKVEPM